MTKRPTISIVMANYNGKPFLKSAVESILAQTFADFEFIIIDDCSVDGSYTYLSEIDDSRVVVVRNDRNLGQTPSLNIGLRRARGSFIARMDSDDLSMPRRLERQIEFLQRYDDIDIVGTQAVVVDSDGRKLRDTNLPEDIDSVWAFSILENPFVHSSVMVRASVFQGGAICFDESVVNQDFDLWSRLLLTRKGANLPDRLVHYRVHGENMTIQRAQKIRDSIINIVLRRLKAEGMADWLCNSDVDQICRYIFDDRRKATEVGVNRLAVAKTYWEFCSRLYRERRVGKQFVDIAVRRAVQSGVWPDGVRNLAERLVLMSKLIRFAPSSVLRLLGETPSFLGRRLQS